MLVLHVYSPETKFGLKTVIESKCDKLGIPVSVLEFSIRYPRFIVTAISKMLVDLIVIDSPIQTEMQVIVPPEELESKNVTKYVFDVSEKDSIQEIIKLLGTLNPRSNNRLDW